MSLTVGSGPFGHRPAGRFDFDPPARVVYVEDTPRYHRIDVREPSRHVRVHVNGELVAESRPRTQWHDQGW